MVDTEKTWGRYQEIADFFTVRFGRKVHLHTVAYWKRLGAPIAERAGRTSGKSLIAWVDEWEAKRLKRRRRVSRTTVGKYRAEREMWLAKRRQLEVEELVASLLDRKSVVRAFRQHVRDATLILEPVAGRIADLIDDRQLSAFVRDEVQRIVSDALRALKRGEQAIRAIGPIHDRNGSEAD